MKIKLYIVLIFFNVQCIKSMKHSFFYQRPLVDVNADELDNPILYKYRIKSIGLYTNEKDTMQFIGTTHNNEQIVHKIYCFTKTYGFKTYLDSRRKSYGKYYYPPQEAEEIGNAIKNYYFKMKLQLFEINS